MKNLKISISQLTVLLNENIAKWGSTDWFLDVAYDGQIEFNHNTYDRGIQLISMYDFENWDNEKEENVPFDKFPDDWLPDLRDLEEESNQYKSSTEKITLEWCD